MEGAIFHTTNDTEVIAYTVPRTLTRSTTGDRRAMFKIKGAYSLVIMSPQKQMPSGPDALGRFPGKPSGAVVFASETAPRTNGQFAEI
jgi:amidophosphoribosyltransferase